jgi:hypothetical protein
MAAGLDKTPNLHHRSNSSKANATNSASPANNANSAIRVLNGS